MVIHFSFYTHPNRIFVLNVLQFEIYFSSSLFRSEIQLLWTVTTHDRFAHLHMPSMNFYFCFFYFNFFFFSVLFWVSDTHSLTHTQKHAHQYSVIIFNICEEIIFLRPKLSHNTSHWKSTELRRLKVVNFCIKNTFSARAKGRRRDKHRNEHKN